LGISILKNAQNSAKCEIFALRKSAQNSAKCAEFRIRSAKQRKIGRIWTRKNRAQKCTMHIPAIINRIFENISEL
jgi:hypothetical protein